jgi:hypothetical protein
MRTLLPRNNGFVILVQRLYLAPIRQIIFIFLVDRHRVCVMSLYAFSDQIERMVHLFF